MPNILKSKLGMFLAGIYLLLIIYSLIEDFTLPPKPMAGLGFLILTAPWSFFLALLLESLGILTTENGDSLLYVLVAFGGLINASILYLLGYLVERFFKFLSSVKPPR